MGLIELYAKFRKTVESRFKFASVVTVDGITIEYEGELKEGETLAYIVTEEGQAPAPDGLHTLTDGTVLTTEGGVVVKIEKPEEQTPDSMEEEKKEEKFMAEIAAADGTMLLIDPAVEVGATVNAMTPEGATPVADGAIELANGQVIEVIDGRIDAITSIEGMKRKTDAMKNIESASAAKIEVHRTEVERRFAAIDSVINSMAEVVGAMVEKLDEMPVEPVKFEQEKKPVATSEKFAAIIQNFRKNNKK
jgi:hypothetical protein